MTFTSRRRCSVCVARRIIFLAPKWHNLNAFNALLMRTVYAGNLYWMTQKLILPSLVMVDGRTVDSKSIRSRSRRLYASSLRRTNPFDVLVDTRTPIDDHDYAPRAVERAKNH
jgi:hypothetical protein